MTLCDQIKWACCTIKGLKSIKKVFTFVVGTCFITLGVLLLVLNPVGLLVNFVAFIRVMWNIFFGVLMLLLQFGKTEWLLIRFGFLGHWAGRAFFFFFCGSNILLVDPDGGSCPPDIAWLCFFSWAIGGMAMSLPADIPGALHSASVL
mmetsp:Transcript_40413/g.127803  ORF Transcript_40413/g.127803 Transcript_40413/m.127803 type:complete len:148 (-) Transcript_40413:461-904(-)